jgi:hypothetical protein
MGLAACAGNAPVIINGNYQSATLDVLQKKFSVCVRGTWNDFSNEKAPVIIPAGERITLRTTFDTTDGPSCQKSLSFIPQNNRHYIADILIYDKVCVVDVVVVDENAPNGLSIPQAIASAQGNCR